MESNNPDVAMAEIEEEMSPFRNFDVVSEVDTNHHFFNQRFGSWDPAGSSAVPAFPAQKKVMKEWKILEESLPDSIYVRVYEGHVDLMRAAIIGSAGTPYHDGLFFFDICFPPEYPAAPPLVNYRSFGVRINPNLYEGGLVCLSLINTWPSSKKVSWNPKKSNILQVLLSIQALVLNKKPYYNEPYTLKSEKESDAYSENVFVLSCKTMMWLLRSPPMGFEAFTAAHFRDRAFLILAACQAYHSGQAKVGYYGIDAPLSNQASPASEQFKASIKSLYPTLLSAFREAGASVGDYIEQLEDTGTTPLDKKAEKKKKKKHIIAKMKKKKKKKKHIVAEKMFGKLRKFLALKKFLFSVQAPKKLIEKKKIGTQTLL